MIRRRFPLTTTTGRVAFLLAISWMMILGRPVTGWCERADIVISDAKVISSPDTVIEHGTVVITAGKIVYVGPRVKQTDARRSIDARGRAVIPGLRAT
jgi:cytosine/adenosine deaminase-related metal-dependent hydrolase